MNKFTPVLLFASFRRESTVCQWLHIHTRALSLFLPAIHKQTCKGRRTQIVQKSNKWFRMKTFTILYHLHLNACHPKIHLYAHSTDYGQLYFIVYCIPYFFINNNNTYFSKSKWILTTLTIINWSYNCHAASIRYTAYTIRSYLCLCVCGGVCVYINQDRREEIVLLNT